MQIAFPGDQRLAAHLLKGALALAAATVIVAAPFPLNLALFPALVAGIATLGAPFLLPMLLAASVPVQDVLSIGEEPLSITTTRGVVVLSVSVLALLLATRRVKPRGHVLLLSFAVYILVMLASMSNAPELGPAIGDVYRWSVALLALWLTILLVRSKSQALAIFATFALAAAGLGAIGAVQTVFGIGPASFALGHFTRAYGSFGMPNSYAGYLEMAALPLLPLSLWAIGETVRQLRTYRLQRLHGYFASSESRRAAVLSAVLAAVFGGGFLLGLAGIVVSFSRGGWLATLGALGVMALFLGRRVALLAGIALLVGFVVIATNAVDAAPEVVQDRYRQIRDQLVIFDARRVSLTSENFAAVERMAHWQTGLAMWESSPWLGTGAGNFDNNYREFKVHPQLIHPRGHAHNYFIHALAETGIIGLAAYLTILATAVAACRRAWRSSDRLARAVGIGAAGMTSALVLHGIVENLHVLNISVQISVVWGLAIVARDWSAAAKSGMHDADPDSTRPRGIRESSNATGETS